MMPENKQSQTAVFQAIASGPGIVKFNRISGLRSFSQQYVRNKREDVLAQDLGDEKKQDRSGMLFPSTMCYQCPCIANHQIST